MKAEFQAHNHYNKNEWFCMMLPSLGIGYCNKFLSITLYVLIWEFSLNLNWEE